MLIKRHEASIGYNVLQLTEGKDLETKIFNLKTKMKIKLKEGVPKNCNGDWCLVKCKGYCHSEMQIARWNGSEWETENETITEYVIGWVKIEFD